MKAKSRRHQLDKCRSSGMKQALQVTVEWAHWMKLKAPLDQTKQLALAAVVDQ
jgi:hypothetical protein